VRQPLLSAGKVNKEEIHSNGYRFVIEILLPNLFWLSRNFNSILVGGAASHYWPTKILTSVLY
jgi:hypothetical protein